MNGETYNGNGSFTFDTYKYIFEYKLTSIKGVPGIRLKGEILKSGSLIKRISINDYLYAATNRDMEHPSLNPFALIRDMLFNEQKDWVLLNKTFQ